MAKAKKKQEAVELPVVNGAVVYTDGGSKPNPGPTGWGFHGYLYQVLAPKKGSGLQGWHLTNVGYLAKETSTEKPQLPLEFSTAAQIEKHLTGVGIVTPTSYIDGYGAYGTDQTNNVGEIDAAFNALLALKDDDIAVVRIITDSQLLFNGMTAWRKGWQKNGWKNSRGEPIGNVELWKRLITVADDYAARGVEVQWEKTQAHVGHVGNDASDIAASAGVCRSTEMRLVHSLGTNSDVVRTPPDGYWKTEAEKHPFIANRRIYFNDLPDMHQPGHYYLGEHGKVDDLLGTRTSEGSLSVLRLAEPIPAIEMLVKQHHDLFLRSSDGLESLILGRLDHLFSPSMTRQLERYGRLAMQSFRGRSGLFDLNNPPVPISVNLTPRGISSRTVDELCQLEARLDTYLKIRDNPESMAAATYAVTDLVPLIYDMETVEDKKTKETSTVYKLKKECSSGFNMLECEVNYLAVQADGSYSIEHVPVRLQLGVDLPGRNNLKRLEDYKPKLRVLTWMCSPDCFRYAVVGETDKDSAIWAGVYSNTRYLLPAATPSKTKKKSKVPESTDVQS